MPDTEYHLPITPEDLNGARVRVHLTGNMRIFHNTREGTAPRVSLIVEVQFHGVLRDLSLIVGNRSYVAAKTALGNNLRTWKGQMLEVEPDESGQYVNVAEV